MKNYWSWTCHRCGHDDNRNNHNFCQKCGAQIRCEAAGGHHWAINEIYCSNGCGKHLNGETHIEKRRQDY